MLVHFYSQLFENKCKFYSKYKKTFPQFEWKIFWVKNPNSSWEYMSGAMETHQHGIGYLEEFPFFILLPWFLGRIQIYRGLILLKDFPIFSIRFLIFWVHFRFSKTVLNSQFVDQFPHFLGSIFPVFIKVLNSQFVDQFPHFFFWSVSPFLCPFPVFRKSSLFTINFR